jgi:hypothetical protein
MNASAPSSQAHPAQALGAHLMIGARVHREHEHAAEHEAAAVAAEDDQLLGVERVQPE